MRKKEKVKNLGNRMVDMTPSGAGGRGGMVVWVKGAGRMLLVLLLKMSSLHGQLRLRRGSPTRTWYFYLHRKLLFTDEIIIYIGLPGVHLVCVQDEWGALLVNYYLQMKLLFS